MTSFTIIIGKLRIKKFDQIIKEIQKTSPEYHVIPEVEKRGWFSCTYKIWVREPCHVSNVLTILEKKI